MSVVRRLLRHPKCEIYFSLMYEFINRFKGTAEFEPHLNELFGCEDWKDLIEIENPEERRTGLYNLYESQLRDAGAKQVIHFDIFDGARLKYSIFFASQHEVGADRMKAAIWKAAPSGDFAFRGTRTPELALAATPDFEPLKKQLREAFADGNWHDISEIVSFREVRRHRLSLGPIEAKDPKAHGRSRRSGSRSGDTQEQEDISGRLSREIQSYLSKFWRQFTATFSLAADGYDAARPLSPRRRSSPSMIGMSAKCHKPLRRPPTESNSCLNWCGLSSICSFDSTANASPPGHELPARSVPHRTWEPPATPPPSDRPPRRRTSEATRTPSHRNAAALLAPKRPTEFDHDQKDQQTRSHAAHLAARLRARSLQRRRVLHYPRAVAEPVLRPPAGRRSASHHEMRRAHANLSGGGTGMAASPGAGGHMPPAIRSSPHSQTSRARACRRS